MRWAQAAEADGPPAQIRSATHRIERVLELSGLTSLFDLAEPPPPPPQASPAGP